MRSTIFQLRNRGYVQRLINPSLRHVFWIMQAAPKDDDKPMRVVMVPVEEYERLLARAICAPKVLPALTGKQKGKIRDAMLDACIVQMQRRQAAAQPQAVQDLAEKTLH